MHLVIRADASPEIGMGHVMRCLALAQAWHDAGGVATLVSGPLPAALESRVRAEALDVVAQDAPPGSEDDAAITADVARRLDAEPVVLDGYHFGPDYQRVIVQAGHRLMAIDDNADADHYRFPDIVLNQNLHAREEDYHDRGADSRLLLGPSYALLRREFARWRGWQRETSSSAQRVLVTLGGSDPENMTSKVVQALQTESARDLEAKVAVGAANADMRWLDGIAQKTAADIRLVTEVDDMAELMAWADIAISASGSTSWELAFMGLPALLIPLAANQEPLASGMDEAGAALDLGDWRMLSPETIGRELDRLAEDEQRRRTMSERGQALVDGLGSQRVVEALSAEASGDNELVLREAAFGDWELLLSWRNDPVSVANSIQSRPVAEDEHKEWLRRKLNDRDSIIYIANSDGAPVGQVRFDLEGTAAEISVIVAPKARGRGLGTAMLRLACSRAGFARYVAHILPENKASVAAFRKAGFSYAGQECVDGVLVERMNLELSATDRPVGASSRGAGI